MSGGVYGGGKLAGPETAAQRDWSCAAVGVSLLVTGLYSYCYFAIAICVHAWFMLLVSW